MIVPYPLLFSIFIHLPKLIDTFVEGMDSIRQNKFSRLIQKELGDLFQRNGRDFFGNVLVTVTEVKVSTDLSVAKIYLSLFGAKDVEQTLSNIKKRAWEIRKRLGNKIKNQARRIPELIFVKDDSIDYAEKIEKLFNDIHKPSEDTE